MSIGSASISKIYKPKIQSNYCSRLSQAQPINQQMHLHHACYYPNFHLKNSKTKIEACMCQINVQCDRIYRCNETCCRSQVRQPCPVALTGHMAETLTICNG